MDTIFTEGYKQVHRGICNRFSNLASPQYLPTSDVRFVYLSARPVKFVSSTRKFISSLSQNQSSFQSNVEKITTSTSLPEGTIFYYPGSLSNVLSMELIKKYARVQGKNYSNAGT